MYIDKVIDKVVLNNKNYFVMNIMFVKFYLLIIAYEEIPWQKNVLLSLIDLSEKIGKSYQ